MAEVHWAPIAAFLACVSCLSSLAAGLAGVLAGVVGTFWARWLPALALGAFLVAWVGGFVAAPRRRLRCERP